MDKKISQQDIEYMRRALELAQRGCGHTNPNPMVGAVIVKEGRIIGEGWHEKCGEGHAEVNAFKHAQRAGENVEGAVMYVTLEPCSHYGKTPPCADLIVEKKLRKVVIAALDPNPLVAGRGVQKLKNAGIEVISGVLEKESMERNKIFMKYIQEKQPYVLLKMAMTLDGKIATAAGESQWISCEESRDQVQTLRNQYMGILVGINTVKADNPRLTCRLENGKNPVRIVVDSGLRIDEDAVVLKDQQQAPTILAIARAEDEAKKERLKKRGIEILEVPKADSARVDLSALFSRLGQMGIDSILVEGGAEIAFSVLEEKLADEVCVYVAPKLVGGRSAKTPLGGDGVMCLEDAIRLDTLQCSRVGEDICLTGKVVK